MRTSQSMRILLYIYIYRHRLTVGRTYLKGTIRRMKGKILLDLAGSVLEDYAYLWDNYYFSTSTL